MKLVTAEEMRSLDQKATSVYGVPGLILMENAGKRVTQVVLDCLGEGEKVLILAGPGNNGGDGLVVARHLYNAGVPVKIIYVGNPEQSREDALVNIKIIKKMKVPFQVYTGKNVETDHDLERADLIVDALFGIGVTGSLREPAAGLVAQVNRLNKKVVAVDLPSGLNADTGEVSDPCIRADCTVTFGLSKPGLYLSPGTDYTGEVITADISLPRQMLDEFPAKWNLTDTEHLKKCCSPRSRESHKGTYGHVLILGGSPGLTGAVALAGEAALRCGAGLVTAGIPVSLGGFCAQKLTEVMTLPLPETPDRTLCVEAAEAALQWCEERQPAVIAVGPGLSTAEGGLAFLRVLLKGSSRPLVIDADGLNLLAQEPELLDLKKGPVVLTPHPGEMARLMDKTVSEIQNNRPAAVLKLAAEKEVIVVLKGSRTLTAAPDGKIFLNITGNPGMATGGSGDVLTGIVAALIAAGTEPLATVAAGVYLHGLAGDCAAEYFGMTALTAGDIIKVLPEVLKSIQK